MNETIPPDDDEQAEADALRLALERGTADPALPEDALQIAALLRYGRDEGQLAPAREAALLEGVLEGAQKIAARAPAVSAPSLWSRFRWLFGATGVSLVTVSALLLVFYGGPRPSERTALPSPDRALLDAQLSRASGVQDPEFDQVMSDYRGDVYRALRAHYEDR